ncbi:MAG: hypothetical protein ABSF26_22025 [Thermoguttaceae bacterium]|jgi:uncharacterized protein involved in exopolysaccharide biosynthesis
MNGTSPQTTLSDLRRVLARHRKKSVLTFVLVVASSSLAAMLLPKSYHSEGKLLARLGKENATIDPMATMSHDPVVAVPQSRDNELNSVAEILKSRFIAEKVVDALGPAFILDQPGPAIAGGDDAGGGWAGRLRSFAQDYGRRIGEVRQWLRRIEGTPPLADRDRAIAGLLRKYSVAAGRRSDVIQIDCQGPSAAWAQSVVAKLIEIYVAEHIRLNRPQKSLEFFSEQTARAHQELTRKEDELRALKTSTGIVSPLEQRQALVAHAARLEQDLVQSEAESKGMENRIRVLRRELAQLPAEQIESSTKGFGNEGTDQMRSQLYQLQVRKEEAAAKYTAAHPLMREIDEELKASQAVAEHQEPTRTHVTEGRSHVYQETQLALVQEEPLLAAVAAKAESLRGQLTALRGQMIAFGQNEQQIARLERAVEMGQANYRKYAANLEQARIDQAQELQRMSNITVAQPATLEPEPVFPRKTWFFAAGCIGGVLAAAAVALTADRRDHSFRVPGDVERRLALAVVGTIPKLDGEQGVFHGIVRG